MSFSRSKRFLEPKISGPAPGAYNPKCLNGAVGSVTFNKSPRERPSRAYGPPVGSYNPYPDSSQSTCRKFNRAQSTSTSTHSINSNASRDSRSRLPSSKPARRRSKSLLDCRVTETFRVDIGIVCSLEHIDENTFKEQLDAAKQELAACKSVVDKKDEELKTLTRTVAEYCTEKDQCLSTITDLTLSLQKAEQTLDKKEAEIANLNSLVEELKQHKEAIKTELSLITCAESNAFVALNEEADVYKMQCAGLQLSLSNLEHRIKIMESEHLDAIRNLKQENDQVLMTSNNLQSQLLKCQEDMREQSVVSAQLETTAIQQAALLHDRSEECETLRRTVTNRDTELQEYAQKVENLKDTIAHCQTEIQQRTQESDHLKQTVAECQRELQHKARDYDNVKNTVVGYKQELQYWTQNCEVLRLNVNEKENTISQLTEDCMCLKLTLTERARVLQQLEEQLTNSNHTVADRENQLHQRVQQCQDLQNTAATLEQVLQDKNGSIVELEDKIRALDTERLTLIDSGLALCQDNDQQALVIDDLKLALANSQAKFEMRTEEVLELKREVQRMDEAMVSLKAAVESQIYEPKMQFDRLTQENQQLKNEMIYYKTAYEELERKMSPFMEQINLYCAERAALIDNENQSAQQINNLLDKYAQLMSHQNKKQKIHHIIRLKEELATSRKETSESRKTIAKYKSQIDQLQDQLNKMQGKRRFDTKKAFACDNKENVAFSDQNNYA